MLYAHPALRSQQTLAMFRDTLVAGDKRWDAIRRIQYSTPGRWVRSLDLSALAPSSITSRLAVDTALTQVFALTPFLDDLRLNPKIALSRRALKCLQDHCAHSLHRITGLSIPDSGPGSAFSDPVTELLMRARNLHELEVVGGGFEDIEDEVDLPSPDDDSLASSSGSLPLRTLALIAIPHSSIFPFLLKQQLPQLRHLTMTAYHVEQVDEQVAAAHAMGIAVAAGGPGLVGGFPGPQPSHPQVNEAATTALFLDAHGSNLETLTLLTAPDWPPIPLTLPRNLLESCPNLRLLNLAFASGQVMGSPVLQFAPPSKPHPLTEIQLSKPAEDLLSCIDAALKTNASPVSASTRVVRAFPSRSPIANTRQTSLLPKLQTVKFTAARWLKLKSRGALNTGVSGGMRHWKTTLRRYGVRVLDTDGLEA